jgi:hypothetical protein
MIAGREQLIAVLYEVYLTCVSALGLHVYTFLVRLCIARGFLMMAHGPYNSMENELLRRGRVLRLRLVSVGAKRPSSAAPPCYASHKLRP